MKTEGVLYTDGHNVTVTYSTIQVKKKWYSLRGITKHNFSILSPIRFHYVLMLIAGLILSIAGLMDLMPASARGWGITLIGIWISVNELAFYSGILVTLLACLLMLFVPERYAVTITTAEGEKNVVVSNRKEYIYQIICALNEAFLAHIDSGIKKTRARQKYLVSAR
jgi:hypothetical protein